jgi:hypothetical protein
MIQSHITGRNFSIFISTPLQNWDMPIAFSPITDANFMYCYSVTGVSFASVGVQGKTAKTFAFLDKTQGKSSRPQH